MKQREFPASSYSAVTIASIPRAAVLAGQRRGGDVPAMGLNGKPIVLRTTDIDDLRGSLRGNLLVPGQDGYDTARRIWNGAFDKRPALIARCAAAADVSRAVQFARANDLLVAVR